MKLWRLCREPYAALNGTGAIKFGGRYSSPGHPVVSMASEAGLAVLVTLRYVLPNFAEAATNYVLGWTEVDANPECISEGLSRQATTTYVDHWLEARRSLLVAIRSNVLPEADVILLNPLHPDASRVPPLTTRPFSFVECLHKPPMLETYLDLE